VSEFEDQMASAGDALTALAEGPGVAAAEALEAAFGRAGQSIEAVLGQAARSGELDFERMAESILRDLARVAAEAVVALGQGGNGGQAVSLNMNFAPGTDEIGVMQSRGAISATLARLVSNGGRFL
tara:strand:- start:1803 stop:2180 length:378 start_codon:yes stop_codon:yes gene_type:complete